MDPRSSARSSRLSDNPVMSGERRSIVPSRPPMSHEACAARRARNRQRAVERPRAEIEARRN